MCLSSLQPLKPNKCFLYYIIVQPLFSGMLYKTTFANKFFHFLWYTTFSNKLVDHFFIDHFIQVECKRAQPKESVQSGTSVALLGKRILLKWDQNVQMLRLFGPTIKNSVALMGKWILLKWGQNVQMFRCLDIETICIGMIMGKRKLLKWNQDI